MALIIVLWTMVFLMFLVGHIEAAGRSEAQLALNLRRNAALQAQADGAIALAAFHLLDRSSAHWPANGQFHVLRVKGGGFTRRIAVRMVDQSGRINLNSAPVPLLQALIQAVGTAPAVAGQIANSIAQWRAPNADAADALKIAAQYRAAGHQYGPPGAPFESLDELGLVQGISPKLEAALRPHLTLYNPGRPNLAFADPVVKRAIGSAGVGGADFIPRPVGLRVISITATAAGPDGTSFTRQAIARVGPQKGGWLRILTWTNPVATDDTARS